MKWSQEWLKKMLRSISKTHGDTKDLLRGLRERRLGRRPSSSSVRNAVEGSEAIVVRLEEP